MREVRLKVGDYYFSKGNYDQAVSWYGKVHCKEKLKLDHPNKDPLIYRETMSKLKCSLSALSKKAFSKINAHFDLEQLHDLNIKSVVGNLIMDLDLSHIISVGGRNYTIAWVANRFSLDISSEENQTYVIDWTEQKIAIDGLARLVDGPCQGSKALMIQGIENYTRISAPPLSLNVREGTLSAWARLIDPLKIYSDLINAQGIIYIYHKGANGRFIITYNRVILGETSIGIMDDKWHHYVFTWKDCEQKFYIDGRQALAATVAASCSIPQPLAIGWLGYNDREQWHGPIAEFLTFDRAFAGHEVSALYGML